MMKNKEQRHNQYFEGVLQLRNPTEETMNFIERSIKEDGDVSITKREKSGDGVDIYLTSNKFLQHLGKSLQKKFGGELKTSARIFTRNRQTSKDVYRLNILFRQHPHKMGDVITIRGERIKITHLGKKVFGKSLETGKKVTVDYRELL